MPRSWRASAAARRQIWQGRVVTANRTRPRAALPETLRRRARWAAATVSRPRRRGSPEEISPSPARILVTDIAAPVRSRQNAPVASAQPATVQNQGRESAGRLHQPPRCFWAYRLLCGTGRAPPLRAGRTAAGGMSPARCLVAAELRAVCAPVDFSPTTNQRRFPSARAAFDRQRLKAISPSGDRRLPSPLRLTSAEHMLVLNGGVR